MQLKKALEQSNLTQEVNDLLLSLKRDHIALGPDYKELEPDEAERQLCLYRLSKKFEIPDNLDPKVRAQRCINDAVAYDQSGPLEFNPLDLSLSDTTYDLLNKLRVEIYRVSRHFKMSSDFIFSPGETLTGLRGDTSLFSKLSKKHNWQVTADCFDLAAGIIYRNRYLKKAAKRLMPTYTKEENSLMWLAMENQFEVFKLKLLDFIEIVPGSRLTTVPKNNSDDRVINIEPFLNMITQLSIGKSLTKCLHSEYGYVKEEAQLKHREMISDLNNATIDLKKASDSNWLAVIKWLFPKRVFRFLNDARSPVTKLPDGTLVDLRMISPMGNGFTFEVMTFVLLCASRLFNDDTSVYGDDIIIPRAHAKPYIDLISILGYKINESKTFIDGNFRESCGGFFSKTRYLRSYDFEYCTDLYDAVICVNKLIALRDILISSEELSTWIKHKVPVLLQKQGPEALEGHVSIPFDMFNVRRFKRRDKIWTGKLIPVLKHKLRKQLVSYQYDEHQCDFHLTLSRKSLDYVTKHKWKSVPRDDIRKSNVIASYLYSGRCLAPTLRNDSIITDALVVY